MAAAAMVLDAYPLAEAVYVCDDGNVFLEESKNLAENHCRTMRLNPPQLVRRDELPVKKPEAKAKKEAEQAAAAEAEAKAKEEAEQAAAAEAEAKAKEEAEQAAAKGNAAKKKGK